MIVRSPGAVALGSFFAVGTAAVMLWDVRALADVTADHALTLGTLVGTIAAGHYIVPAVCQGRLLAALGLVIAFCAGTFICVTGSAGRGGEVIQRRTAEASRVNDQRRDAQDELKKARGRRDELANQLTRECGSGKGPKCEGIRSTISYADSHIAILQVRIDNMQAEQTANVKLKKAAEVIAFFGIGDRAEVERGLELLWPFANALIWELLTIVFLSLGLGHRRPVSQGKVEVLSPVASPAIALPVREERISRGCLALPAPGQHPVIVALDRAGRPLSNIELAEIMGCSAGEASKRRLEVAHLVRVARQGRQLSISRR